MLQLYIQEYTYARIKEEEVWDHEFKGEESTREELERRKGKGNLYNNILISKSFFKKTKP